jgi:hypothetical protein
LEGLTVSDNAPEPELEHEPDDLPPKPPIEDMPPEEGDEPPADDDEVDVDEADYLAPEDAAGDETVDNAEAELEPRLKGDAPD